LIERPKTQVKAYLDFQGGGFPINRPLPSFDSKVEKSILKRERIRGFCIHRDYTHSIESTKI